MLCVFYVTFVAKTPPPKVAGASLLALDSGTGYREIRFKSFQRTIIALLWEESADSC